MRTIGGINSSHGKLYGQAALGVRKIMGETLPHDQEWGGDLNESSDDRPRRHADSCWPRMGALRSIDARPDYRLKCLRRSAVFGTLKGLAGRTAIVRATIS
jgi:hypothetical protein